MSTVHEFDSKAFLRLMKDSYQTFFISFSKYFDELFKASLKVCQVCKLLKWLLLEFFWRILILIFSSDFSHKEFNKYDMVFDSIKKSMNHSSTFR